MLGSRRFTIVLLAAAATGALPAAAQSQDGDWILRAAPGYFVPTADATTRGVGFADFTDARVPPQGTIELAKDDRSSAQGDLGLGIELEHMLTDLIGVSAGFGYTDVVSETTLSGEATFTPYLGEPLRLTPERGQSGAITGGATGRVHLLMLTAGASFHLVRNEDIDVYLGPVIGLAASEPHFAHGTMLVTFGWISTTPLEGTGGDTRLGLALGAVFGIDRPLGRGWLLSASARYLRTGALNPSMVQLGLGYRF